MIYVDSFPMSDLSVYPVPIELKGFLLTMKHPKVIFTHCICFPYLYASQQLRITYTAMSTWQQSLVCCHLLFFKKQFLHFKHVQTSMKIVWSHNCHYHY